ncbi:MAG: DEAD/DEAH box helicase [Muribaculaceae bacterium]|nr:DEAD/DEAH box helicase [Muribaculaceae bacterium]
MKEKDILQLVKDRMGIEALNDMQCQALNAWKTGGGDLVLYSPTGTGKTLAFALCLLQALKPPMQQLQAVVLSPSRELVMQTAEILRQLADGYKVTPCYGGHAVADEKASLAVTPDIVVATPGRLLDHHKRGNINLRGARLLVLDEMDKSLELGFEDEMRQLLKQMPHLNRRILASATVLDVVPDYVRLHNPFTLNVLEGTEQPAERITVWQVLADNKDKLDTLHRLLLSLRGGKTIVFANYRESVERIHQWLVKNRIDAGIYHGAMEQQERECAVALLNNGSVNVLVSTDLASRGLDIDTVEHIVHYHLPVSEQAYIHRNGRTARVDANGEAYVITAPNEPLPEWISVDDTMEPYPAREMPQAPMATLYFQAGKKEKLSRGDIMGFIANNGDIPAGDIGRIDVRDHYALAAVPRHSAQGVLKRLQAAKIKGKKVRISIISVSAFR